MKKQTIPAIAALIFSMLLFTGCFKDDCRHAYKIYTPVYKKLSELRSEVKLTAATPLNGTAKLYVTGNRIYLSEKDKGVHVIDNSNPANPKNAAFINIPGNGDVVVRGNMMYADLYCDLATIEINNTNSIAVKNYLTNLLPYRLGVGGRASSNPDSIMVQVDWTSKDTIVSCEQVNAWASCPNCNFLYASASSSAPQAAKSGTGGSMARFADVNNYMYVASNAELNVVDLTDAYKPVKIKSQSVGSGLETVYPFKNNLFLGSTTGMFVYDIKDPINPKAVTWRGHWRICDPVIADDKYAYVTLFSASVCGGTINEMQVYSLTDIYNPTLVKTYPLTNPHGLAKDGDVLFVCDGRDGLKVYDAINANNIKLIKQFEGIDAYDVVALNGIAYVSAKGGLYQYDYSSTNNIRLLSKLTWQD